MAEIDFYFHVYGTKDAVNVKELSPADVVPRADYESMEQTVYKLTQALAERKHGKWIWQLADNGWADNICSVCGYTINDDIHVHVDYNFCPNCGADMRN